VQHGRLRLQLLLLLLQHVDFCLKFRDALKSIHRLLS
jgi:hypothetical protein